MKEANRVHALVASVLQDAMDKGNEYEGFIELDFFSLCTESEDLITYAEPNNLKLRVYLKLEFDASDDMGYGIDELIGEDDDESEEDPRGSNTSETCH